MKVTELSDIKVDTVGLVKRGANQEEFFLLKEDAAEPGFWDKLRTVVKELLAPLTPTKESQEVKEVSEKAEVVETKKEEVKVEAKVEAPAAPVAEVKTEPEKVETVKQTTTPDVTALIERVNTMQKALEEMQVKLTESNGRVQKAEDTVIERTYLEKAEQFAAIPVKKDELARHLTVLARVDKATADYFEVVLGTMNNIAKDSGLYGEIGTTRTPEEVEFSKIARDSKDPTNAILEQSVEAQEKYLLSMYEKAKGK